MVDELARRQDQLVKLLISNGGLTRPQIQSSMSVATTTLLRDLDALEQEGRIRKMGDGKATTYEVASQANRTGVLKQVLNSPTTRVTATTSVIADEEPLVEVKITNPITYFKHWWQKVIGNEGIKLKFSLEIRPLTAITLVLILATLGLGLTTVGAVLKYLPFYQRFQQFVTTPDNSRETAMEGKLYRQADSDRYFLFTANLNEAVWVQAPAKLELAQFDNQHVILTGSYNDQTNILSVTSIRTLTEVKKPSAPALAPIPEPTATPLPSVSPSPASSPSAQPIPGL